MQPLRNTIQKGFTLVELLIVVIILALLAAIVVPQFASSTDDAKLASLDTTLSNLRAAIDLYYQQHGAYPGELTAVDAYLDAAHQLRVVRALVMDIADAASVVSEASR